MAWIGRCMPQKENPCDGTQGRRAVSTESRVRTPRGYPVNRASIWDWQVTIGSVETEGSRAKERSEVAIACKERKHLRWYFALHRSPCASVARWQSSWAFCSGVAMP